MADALVLSSPSLRLSLTRCSNNTTLPSNLRAPAVISIPGGAGQARTICFFGDRREAARKALESALGDKKETFDKWGEEIKKREAGGGGPKGRGRGWGGGGGGGGNSGGRDDSSSEGGNNENKWEESMQIVYAFGGLTALYLVLTQGKAMVSLFMNSVLYVSRGFKRPAPRRPALSGAEARGSAADDVRKKWGSDDE